MPPALYPLKLYIKHPPIAGFLLASAILNAAAWLWLAIEIHPRADYFFLHYNILFGVDEVGVWWQILYVPLTGLLILTVNTLIGWLVFARDKYISYFLLAAGFICQCWIMVTAALLIRLNV